SSITYGNSRFVAVAFVSDGEKILSSNNGVTWTDRTSPFVGNFTNVLFGGGIFVAVTNTGQIATSSIGTTWTERTTPGVFDASRILYSDDLDMFLIISSFDEGEYWMSPLSDGSDSS